MCMHSPVVGRAGADAALTLREPAWCSFALSAHPEPWARQAGAWSSPPQGGPCQAGRWGESTTPPPPPPPEDRGPELDGYPMGGGGGHQGG